MSIRVDIARKPVHQKRDLGRGADSERVEVRPVPNEVSVVAVPRSDIVRLPQCRYALSSFKIFDEETWRVLTLII
jgi:hypothetical protein